MLNTFDDLLRAMKYCNGSDDVWALIDQQADLTGLIGNGKNLVILLEKLADKDDLKYHIITDCIYSSLEKLIATEEILSAVVKLIPHYAIPIITMNIYKKLPGMVHDEFSMAHILSILNKEAKSDFIKSLGSKVNAVIHADYQLCIVLSPCDTDAGMMVLKMLDNQFLALMMQSYDPYCVFQQAKSLGGKAVFFMIGMLCNKLSAMPVANPDAAKLIEFLRQFIPWAVEDIRDCLQVFGLQSTGSTKGDLYLLLDTAESKFAKSQPAIYLSFLKTLNHVYRAALAIDRSFHPALFSIFKSNDQEFEQRKKQIHETHMIDQVLWGERRLSEVKAMFKDDFLSLLVRRIQACLPPEEVKKPAFSLLKH